MNFEETLDCIHSSNRLGQKQRTILSLRWIAAHSIANSPIVALQKPRERHRLPTLQKSRPLTPHESFVVAGSRLCLHQVFTGRQWSC